MQQKRLVARSICVGRVLAIDRAFDSFPRSSDPQTTVYCHKIIMEITRVQDPPEGGAENSKPWEELPIPQKITCQECTEQRDMLSFTAGEIVIFEVKSLSKSLYNIRKLSPATPPVETKTSTDNFIQDKQNEIVWGDAADLQMITVSAQAAATVMMYQTDVTAEKVVSYADTLLSWMRRKAQGF